MTKSLHLNRDWLYQKYAVEKLSTYDIAKIVNRDPKRIYEKLIDFEIPTRPRGQNLKGDDNWMIAGNVNPMLGRKHTKETKALLSKKASVPKPYLRGKSNGMYMRRGTLSPNYKHGLCPERQRVYASSEWKELVRRVKTRDGGNCVRCGKRVVGHKAMGTHHKKSWKQYPALRLDVSNVVTVCETCHLWIHSKKNTRREFID